MKKAASGTRCRAIPVSKNTWNAWITAAGISRGKKSPLFRSMGRANGSANGQCPDLCCIRLSAGQRPPASPIRLRPYLRRDGGSPHICRMGARWSTPRPSRIMNRPAQPSSTIALVSPQQYKRQCSLPRTDRDCSAPRSDGESAEGARSAASRCAAWVSPKISRARWRPMRTM
jgi:hypothetical protein